MSIAVHRFHSMFAVLLCLALPNAHACEKGQQQVLTCKTKNDKVLKVCNAGKDATYSFGRSGTKPEMFIKAPKTSLRYMNRKNPVEGQGGHTADQSLQFQNGAASYTVKYGKRPGDAATASVVVESKGKHLASVACRSETVVANFEVLGMDTHVQKPPHPQRIGPKPGQASGGIVFAKRAKPRVHEFVWSVHHPEGVKFDGPIRTSIGTLHTMNSRHPEHRMEWSDGFGLDGVPVVGPHGKYAEILYGSILDYGGRLAIIYSYRADGDCMACGSDAVLIVDKGGKVVDQLNRPEHGSEQDPNRCLFPDAESFVDGAAIVRASKDCEGPNRLMRIGFEGIEVSGR